MPTCGGMWTADKSGTGNFTSETQNTGAGTINTGGITNYVISSVDVLPS